MKYVSFCILYQNDPLLPAMYFCLMYKSFKWFPNPFFIAAFWHKRVDPVESIQLCSPPDVFLAHTHVGLELHIEHSLLVSITHGGLLRNQWSGGHLNKKIPSYQYRDPQVKDKTVSLY